MLLTLTIERVIAVWKPIESSQMCTTKLAYYVVASLSLAICIFYSHEAFGASFFCPGVNFSLCPADNNGTHVHRVKENSPSTVKRDLRHILSHYGFPEPYTVTGLRSTRVLDLGLWSEGDVHWSRRVNPVKRRANERKVQRHPLADTDSVYLHPMNGVFIRRYRPTRQNDTYASNNSPASTKTTGKNRVWFVRKHLKVLKGPKWPKPRTLRPRRDSNKDQYIERTDSDYGSSEEESAGKRSAANSEDSCDYLIFHGTLWPVLDTVVNCVIPLSLMFLGDVAVAYKIFFKTRWTFVTPSEGGRTSM